MTYAFASADAPDRKRTQYFEIMGSRAIYHDGYIASALGPRAALEDRSRLRRFSKWTPDKDTWELYDLRRDFSAGRRPREGAAAKAGRVGQAVRRGSRGESCATRSAAACGSDSIPSSHKQNPATEFHYTRRRRHPGSVGPKLGLRSSLVTINAELKDDSQGVLYALGGYSGGLAAWIDNGRFSFEYNLYEIERTRIETTGALPRGRVKIEIESRAQPSVRNGPMDVTIRVNGTEMARGRVPRTTGYALSGNDSFDVGRDSYSPVSPAYYDRAPFKFTGKIEKLDVKYLPAD